MAAGIQFYQSKNYKGFEDCVETIKFTLMMNSLFDALNRKFPSEGIKKNSSDLEVLWHICRIFRLHVNGYNMCLCL